MFTSIVSCEFMFLMNGFSVFFLCCCCCFYLPVCVSVCLVHPSETSSEIQRRVSSLEEDLSVKDSMLKTTQSELVQCKKELAAKELNLQKTLTRIAQESERVKTHCLILLVVLLLLQKVFLHILLIYIFLKLCSFCHKGVGLRCQYVSL